MNDLIKEFVEQNREAFDELEAPAFNLERFKTRLNLVPERKSKKLWLSKSTKWLVAASVLIALGTTFLVLRENDTPPSTDNLVQKIKMQPDKIATDKDFVEKTKVVQVKSDKRLAHAHATKKLRKKFEQIPLSSVPMELYAELSDSSSSSVRLSAILDIAKSDQMSNDLLNRLAETLNHDENSNVRLAALSVLEKYSYDAYASALLVRSLNTQSDPMVQLGLVTILGKMKNLNINDKLYALASDPNTFDAVKDEAYSILLKEDKL